MQDNDFYKLEEYVDHLIDVCAKLRQENTVLRKIQQQLINERDELLRKNDTARRKVETLLKTLKAKELQEID